MNIPEIGFKQGATAIPEIEVVELSELYTRKFKDHNPQAPHRLSFFMLVLLEQGQGRQMVDFNDYAFKPGTLISVQQDQVTAFQLAAQLKGKLLLFTQSFLDKVHANMRLPNYTPTHLNSCYSPVLELDDANFARTRALIGEIQTELACDDGDPLIIMYLFSALTLLHRRLKTVGEVDNLSAAHSKLLARFIALLQVHFQHTRDAHWYADQLSTTYKTLNLITKAATALTAKQMIDAFTIIEIKRRLVISKVTTQQLAYDFGYEDASNFVKYFKKEAGMTPSAFRRLYIND